MEISLDGWDIGRFDDIRVGPWGSGGNARAKVLANGDGYFVAYVEAEPGYAATRTSTPTPSSRSSSTARCATRAGRCARGDGYVAAAGSIHDDFETDTGGDLPVDLQALTATSAAPTSSAVSRALLGEPHVGVDEPLPEPGVASRRSSPVRAREVGGEGIEDGVEREVVGVVAPGVALAPRRRSSTPSTRPRSAPRPARSVPGDVAVAASTSAHAVAGSRASSLPGRSGGSAALVRRRGRRRGTRVGVEHAAVLCVGRVRGRTGRRRSVRPVRELAAVAVAEPGDAGGDRHAPPRRTGPLWCITTSSHCGTTLRLAPRNSGTSVWTASSWPGSSMLA